MPYDMAEADVLAKSSTSTFSKGSAVVVDMRKEITAAVRRNEKEGLRSILKFLLLRNQEQMWGQVSLDQQAHAHNPADPPLKWSTTTVRKRKV